MRALLVVAALAAAGCVEVETVQGPDGEELYQVTCYDEGLAPCMNEAAETCGGRGYKILDKKSEDGEDVIFSGGTLIAADSSTDRLIFKCKDAAH